MSRICKTCGVNETDNPDGVYAIRSSGQDGMNIRKNRRKAKGVNDMIKDGDGIKKGDRVFFLKAQSKLKATDRVWTVLEVGGGHAVLRLPKVKELRQRRFLFGEGNRPGVKLERLKKAPVKEEMITKDDLEIVCEPDHEKDIVCRYVVKDKIITSDRDAMDSTTTGKTPSDRSIVIGKILRYGMYKMKVRKDGGLVLEKVTNKGFKTPYPVSPLGTADKKEYHYEEDERFGEPENIILEDFERRTYGERRVYAKINNEIKKEKWLVGMMKECKVKDQMFQCKIRTGFSGAKFILPINTEQVTLRHGMIKVSKEKREGVIQIVS